MSLTPDQKEALRLLSQAYDAIAKVWTDEVGNELAEGHLLPLCDLYEGAEILREISRTGDPTMWRGD